MDKNRLSAYICVGVVIFGSLATNLIQYNSLSRLEALKDIFYAKDKVISNSFDEMIYQTMIKGQQESSYQNGKIEGFVLAMSGGKMPETETSALWHNGYYRGLSQIGDIERTSFENGYRLCAKENSIKVNEKTLDQLVLNIFKDKNNPVSESKVGEGKK